MHGLGTDTVVEMEMVLPDDSIVYVSEHENEGENILLISTECQYL